MRPAEKVEQAQLVAVGIDQYGVGGAVAGGDRAGVGEVAVGDVELSGALPAVHRRLVAVEVLLHQVLADRAPRTADTHQPPVRRGAPACMR
ncbi:hypothetical protein ACFVWG_33725 [Kribbella sp. NPDC058245]|uniref:hypothetical protein n=1 Tax=Kribbella sp. NPDC058245 TaxID=3346399 RepID=UPI0036E14BC1